MRYNNLKLDADRSFKKGRTRERQNQESRKSRTDRNEKIELRNHKKVRPESNIINSMMSISKIETENMKRETERDHRTSPQSDTYQDEVRTLFVSGLPSDVKQRELHLLFRAYKGFESAVLKLPPQKPGKVYPIAPVAFVTFQRKCDAQIAIDKLQGEKFDDEYATTLRLEFAKSNTKNKMKSLKELDTSAIPILTMGNNFIDQLILPSDVSSTQTQPQSSQITINSAGMPRGIKRRQATEYRHNPFSRPMEVQSSMVTPFAHQQYVANVLLQPQMFNQQIPQVPQQRANGNPNQKPAQLYVSNLSGNIKDQELTQLFQQYHGFSKARVTSPGCGLVEFSDYVAAQYAITQLNQKSQFLGAQSGMVIQPIVTEY